ncbi:hypothetical protein N4842_15895, partial [Enterococcus faecalis]|nr:hypothetical protein [Enterococcus faecalis]
MLQFTFLGNGFLHKMVCILDGILLEIGAGTKELAIIDELFATKVRAGAGETAPAQWMFLSEVSNKYQKNKFSLTTPIKQSNFS